MKPRCVIPRTALLACLITAAAAQSPAAGFRKSAQFDEQVRWQKMACGVRTFVDVPAKRSASRRLLAIYATPNGNTIEQTLGCAASQGLDWRYDIQHVAAQIRRLRELDASRDVVLAVVQAPKLSWPTFRRDRREADSLIYDLVASLGREVAADNTALLGHSGGGSFLFGYINTVDTIPAKIERLVFLDANYAYSEVAPNCRTLHVLNPAAILGNKGVCHDREVESHEASYGPSLVQ